MSEELRTCGICGGSEISLEAAQATHRLFTNLPRVSERAMLEAWHRDTLPSMLCAGCFIPAFSVSNQARWAERNPDWKEV